MTDTFFCDENKIVHCVGNSIFRPLLDQWMKFRFHTVPCKKKKEEKKKKKTQLLKF